MKKLFSFIFLICSMFYLNAQPLTEEIKPSLSKSGLAEKIYLQIDNALYQVGETIWYKAIVSKSYDNSLSDISGILNVELIDANETVIESQLLKLNAGIASGSFSLEKGYDSGKYHIRAYTKWNRNFDGNFVFSQPIEIINLQQNDQHQDAITNVVVGKGEFSTLKADINPALVNPSFKGKLKLFINMGSKIDSIELDETKDGIYKLGYLLPEDATKAELKFKVASSPLPIPAKESYYRKTIAIDTNHVDLQFFPEGGKLINSLQSTVGFKALGYKGTGHQINGKIEDDKGNHITTFKSNKLGMGTFKLLPEIGRSYFAVIKRGDVTFRYNLPVARAKGVVMTAVELKGKIRLLIASTLNKADKIMVQTESRGVRYHNLEFDHNDQTLVSISKNTLPDGIVKITVTDDRNKVLCERLFFNEIEDNRLKITVDTDNGIYLQREKVRLDIELDSMQKENNISLSVLVLDQERASASNNNKTNILSHLLLRSELKGFIENPSYYFEASNLDRKLDLDALMLTQGWRDYNYHKQLPLSYFEHQPEKNLILSGTIGEYFNPKNRPKNPLDLNLVVQGKEPQVYTMKIPKDGTYHFDLNDIYKDNAEFFMQAVNKKGKPVDLTFNLDKRWRPDMLFGEQITFEIPTEERISFVKQMEEVNDIQQKYETTFNTIALDEVTLKGYKLTPKRKEFIGFHGEPTSVIDGKKLNENAPKNNYGVFSVLRSQYSDEIDVIMVNSLPPFLVAWERGYDFTYTLVDNIPIQLVDYRQIQDIPIEEITGIDILKKPKDSNRYCTKVLPGINRLCPQRVVLLNIYTKTGRGLFGISKVKGAFVSGIEGFSEAIEFYAPKYENLSNQDWIVPDNRSVIHWNPNIAYSKDGEYKVEYYNSDHVGDVKVIIEAISKDGKVGYIEKTYMVKEAER